MDSIELRKIGKRIADERHRQSMTQSELAVACGLTLKTISMLETGQRELKVDSLLRICDCLQISADYILMGTSLDADALYFKNILSNLEPEVSQRIKSLLETLNNTRR